MAKLRIGFGWNRKATLRVDLLRVIELPVFLCPALSRPACFSWKRPLLFQFTLPSHRQRQPTRALDSNTHSLPRGSHYEHVQNFVRLPQQCAGCGAFSQTSCDVEPGFYSLGRRSVKAFLAPRPKSEIAKRVLERETIQASLHNLEDDVLKSLSFNVSELVVQQSQPPLCDRCHKLLHHHSGVSILHPSIKSIQDMILESPHKYNHIYHIIDAADFPLSLIPRIHQLLRLTPQRSLNRRSKTGKFYHGRKNELSFIITRSDLLAPLKTQVDSLMPYLVSVLRDALGSIGRDVRLGNVRCVSAKRGWWTKELKEDIWNSGGGGWMVGKANVGKSQLFGNIFPKGRYGLVKLDQPLLQAPGEDQMPSAINPDVSETIKASGISESSGEWSEKLVETEFPNAISLLPPLQSETDYPVMPLVSPLPGTTESPIRLPFANGKGELIDLPGLSRSDLETYVQEPHRPSLFMHSRIRPEQQILKPGQSLLLGGFIRITPRDPDTTILAYAFTPISSHLTSTNKAILIQNQQRDSGVQNIAIAGVGEKIESAGKFALKWDVTKQRSGPITARDAACIKVDRLPYRVLSTDILIEGCGWVELVTQVRVKVLELTCRSLGTPSGDQSDDGAFGNPRWPEVEVFSPEGRFISARRPLGAWVLGEQMKPASRMKSRPRRSMKGMKRKKKALERIARA